MKRTLVLIVPRSSPLCELAVILKTKPLKLLVEQP